VTFDEAKEVLAELARRKVEYVLIGSMAMAAQGLPRATRDMDFFVDPRRDNIERLKQALRALFQDPHIDEIDADELAGAYPALEYVPPHGRYSMDILTRLGEAFRFEDIESEELQIDDFTIRVATPRMLYRMKKDTVRPQDRADAARIRESFDLREE
jgi:hypothetical protein